MTKTLFYTEALVEQLNERWKVDAIYDALSEYRQCVDVDDENVDNAYFKIATLFQTK